MNPKDLYSPMNRDMSPVNHFNIHPTLNGRPERDTIISEDEILDLRIALNTSTFVDQFLQLM